MASTIGSRLGSCIVGWPASCGAKTVWYFQCGRAKSARPLTIVRPSPIVKTKLLSTGSEPSVTTRSMRAGRRHAAAAPCRSPGVASGRCAKTARPARRVRSGPAAGVGVCSWRPFRSGSRLPVRRCRPTARSTRWPAPRPARASDTSIGRVVEAAQRRRVQQRLPPAPGRRARRCAISSASASSAQACSGAWLAMQHGAALRATRRAGRPARATWWPGSRPAQGSSSTMHGRILRQRARQQRELALAAAQRVEAALGEVADADALQRRPARRRGRAHRGRTGSAGDGCAPSARASRTANGKVPAPVLRHVGQAARARRRAASACTSLPVHAHAAVERPQQAQQAAQQGALAAAVRARAGTSAGRPAGRSSRRAAAAVPPG